MARESQVVWRRAFRAAEHSLLDLLTKQTYPVSDLASYSPKTTSHAVHCPLPPNTRPRTPCCSTQYLPRHAGSSITSQLWQDLTHCTPGMTSGIRNGHHSFVCVVEDATISEAVLPAESRLLLRCNGTSTLLDACDQESAHPFRPPSLRWLHTLVRKSSITLVRCLISVLFCLCGNSSFRCRFWRYRTLLLLPFSPFPPFTQMSAG